MAGRWTNGGNGAGIIKGAVKGTGNAALRVAGREIAEEAIEAEVKSRVARSIERTIVRTTRSGDKAVRITRPGGSVIDISAKRVKECVPNIHPKAPPGTLKKVKFPNAQQGSKGYK